MTGSTYPTPGRPCAPRTALNVLDANTVLRFLVDKGALMPRMSASDYPVPGPDDGYWR